MFDLTDLKFIIGFVTGTVFALGTTYFLLLVFDRKVKIVKEQVQVRYLSKESELIQPDPADRPDWQKDFDPEDLSEIEEEI